MTCIFKAKYHFSVNFNRGLVCNQLLKHRKTKETFPQHFFVLLLLAVSRALSLSKMKPVKDVILVAGRGFFENVFAKIFQFNRGELMVYVFKRTIILKRDFPPQLKIRQRGLIIFYDPEKNQDPTKIYLTISNY